MSANKIFVSYRRQDASGEAGRLVDHLEEVFGDESVFLDVETLEAGLDFVQAIDQALNSCKVLIAIIGPHWINIKDADGNLRLFNEGDFIRIEIAAALERNIRVIPVLVNGAKMPSNSALPEDLKALNRRHAHELSSSRWKYDTDQLIEVLSKIIEPKKKPVDPKPVPSRPMPQPKPKGWFAKNYLWVLGVSVVLLVLMAIGSEDFQEGIEEGYNESVTETTDIGQEYSSPDPGSTSNPNATPSGQTNVKGGWNLVLGGEVVSFLEINQSSEDVTFIEYNLLEMPVGQGTGFWEDGILYLDYYNSLMDVSGEFEFQSINEKRLSGTLYIPINNSTSAITLNRIN